MMKESCERTRYQSSRQNTPVRVDRPVRGSFIALLLIPLVYNEKDQGLNKELRPCVIHRAAAKRSSRKPGSGMVCSRKLRGYKKRAGVPESGGYPTLRAEENLSSEKGGIRTTLKRWLV
jgi:hypothetical protein